MPSVAYSERALGKALPVLRELLTVPEGVEQVPRVLAECGVRFVIVEPVPGSKIDGVCFWLDRKHPAPVIGMSLRLDKIDNFWFVLRHEIEHVLRGHGREEAIVDRDSEGTPVEAEGQRGEEERIANEAGGAFGVSEADMADFILRVRPIFSEQNVLNFATRMQVHPGIVVGQIQRRTGRYDLLRKHLVKVRQIIVRVAMTDGYGQALPVKS
jgi:HTH-type transcriptional regulator / antitoxin HigA